MEEVKQKIKQILDIGNEIRETFLARWQENSNRRTLIIAGVTGALVLFSYAFFIRPPGDFPAGQLVEVPEGQSLSEIARYLKEENVVRSSFLLRMTVSLFGYEKSVQFGDYLFAEPKSVFFVARAIGIGARGLEPTRIRVPEGATVEEMSRIFGEQLERFNEDRFLSAAKDAEGYFFPDTYFFLPNADDDLVLRTLRENFDVKISTIQNEIDASGESLEDLVVMASLLEREAHNMEDRRKIAGVLWNRLERNMLLQVDAAFLYTLGKATFDLTLEDLESDSPYNTYRYKGLPPTPIGSPSLESILAAATPIESDYLYYLADKDFVTHYSETYEEHLRKKRLYLGS